MIDRKSVLPNGLRVVSHQMKERDSVSLGFWVGTGGRHEEDRLKGAAHFLEHILFKGSENYSCDDIKKEVEGVGGSLNAFTGEEQTCFYAKIPSRFVAKTLDVLFDMVSRPLIAQDDVEKERAVILEEIKMYRDLPQYFVMELLDELVWPDHPLGKALTGTMESVGQMTAQDLRAFHQSYYRSGNMIVAAAGHIQHQDFVDMIKRKIHLPKMSCKNTFRPADHQQIQSHSRFFHKEIEQMHLALGMYGLPQNHPDKYVLHILNVILGGNMSSRLFDVIREKKGLAYSISSGVKNMSDTGMFLVRAGVDNTKIVEATRLIIQELDKIKKDGVSRDEFTRAKDYFLGQLLLGLEDTLDHMLWIADSVMVRNRVLTLNHVLAQVKKIKPADIVRVARDVINPEHYNLAIVGPLESKVETQLREVIGG